MYKLVKIISIGVKNYEGAGDMMGIQKIENGLYYGFNLYDYEWNFEGDKFGYDFFISEEHIKITDKGERYLLLIADEWKKTNGERLIGKWKTEAIDEEEIIERLLKI